MDPLAAAFARAAQNELLPPGASVLLAVSGGADSLAMLHAACESAGAFAWRLSVAHVHHGWRGREAERDLGFVRDHARRLGLPCFVRRCDARAESRRNGLSPEAGARQVRYGALLEIARGARADRIATAHQRDDVLESYLLARDRRAGVSGLAGPRSRREDGVVRPILTVSRGEIRAYLAIRGLSFRRDRSNGDLWLARNRIRRLIAAARPARRAAWEEEVRRWSALREALDCDLADREAAAIRPGPDCVLADAETLLGWPADLQRRAVERAAAPFARPGRPPFTGREREEILRRLARGGDFRREAGRRIAIERRGRILSFSLRREASASDEVYDSRQLPSGDILHGQPAPRAEV